MNKDFFVQVSNNMLIENKDSKESYLLSNEALLIYILIIQTMTLRNYCTFSIYHLLDCMCINHKQTVTIEKIKNCLLELNQMNVFTYYEDVYFNKQIKDISKIKRGDKYFVEVNYVFDDNFFIVYDDEIKKLLDYCKGKKNIDKFKLAGYFCYLVMRMNKENKICYPSFDKIEYDVGIGIKAIMSYNNILKQLQLIDYINGGYRIVRGKVKQDVNYYCRYEDRDCLKEYAKRFKEDNNLKGQTTLEKKKSNKKRSLKQKINYLEKVGDDNGVMQVKEIYDSL
ncbi:hypothetical protein CJF20_04710 [Clostridium botulinum]|uniref:hypothetical protein n=1 Tax=Clostridium botulinum TaxID=1491 RepID=UPI00196A10A6|nr:hypothetical protein [Clostridium botulinum]MBN3437824.1 hypothetical protein [Clostridium botulinum]